MTTCTLIRPWGLFRAQLLHFVVSTITLRWVYQKMYAHRDVWVLHPLLVVRREWQYFIVINPFTGAHEIVWTNPKIANAYTLAEAGIRMLQQLKETK